MTRRLLVLPAAFVILLAVPIRPLAHESPIDHVDRGIRIWVDGETIHLRYQLQLSERAAMMQLQSIDSNADGVVSEGERDAFFTPFAEILSSQLHLQIGEKAVELKPDGRVRLLPQFRQEYTFSGPLGVLEKGRHFGKLTDDFSRNYPGTYRWDGKNSETTAGPSVTVTEAPKAVDAAGHPGVLVLKFELKTTATGNN